MNVNENKWDKFLNIKTTGRDDSHSDQHHYPYEPTPYIVLERLANSGYIGKKNLLVDYGCGKGRVGFFMAYQTRCKAIGIEYDDQIFSRTLINQKSAISSMRTQFFLANAQNYSVHDDADRFFFFNPFSVEILKRVLCRIMESYYDNPRHILLFFYYPSDEYISHLMLARNIMFYDEIDCQDLFEGTDSRERIMIFEIGR